jgi:hypothetical protein
LKDEPSEIIAREHTKMKGEKGENFPIGIDALFDEWEGYLIYQCATCRLVLCFHGGAGDGDWIEDM